jgi:hypothetical protein
LIISSASADACSAKNGVSGQLLSMGDLLLADDTLGFGLNVPSCRSHLIRVVAVAVPALEAQPVERCPTAVIAVIAADPDLTWPTRLRLRSLVLTVFISTIGLVALNMR